MTLVLLWRVPARRVGVRWRGPAGLTLAVEREPLAPVAAVVGPPGTGGSAFFPPLAILANAATPVPANGTGSVAWSTMMSAPVIWDGAAWRSFTFFVLPPDPAPSWVPANALVVADFAEGNYWLQGNGECTLADILPVSTGVVEGVGFTTGEQSSDTAAVYHFRAFSAGAYALLAAGFSMKMDFAITVTGTQIGNDWAECAVKWYDADFNKELLANAYRGNGGSKHIRAEVYNYPGVGTRVDVADATVTGTHTSIAASLDPATGTVLMSYLGATQEAAVFPASYDALNAIYINVTHEPAGSGAYTSNATIKRVTFYPLLDQAELNALTATHNLDFMDGALPDGATLERASAGSMFDDAGMMQIAAADVARFDYHPLTHAPRGLLIEPAATNTAAYSQVLENGAWLVEGAAITANAVIAPDGAATADKLSETATTGLHRAYNNSAGPIANGLVTVSLFLKSAERAFALLDASDYATGDAKVVVNLADGTLGTPQISGSWSGASAAIEALPNGFFRASVTATKGAGAQAVPIIYTLLDGSGTTSYAGAAGSGLYAWGAQVEVGPVATSYIPTAGGTATRAADELTITVPAGMTTAHCTIEGGSQDVPVTPGPVALTAADFGGPVWLQGITFS